MAEPNDRRCAVPFDPDYFAGQADRGLRYGLTETFRHVYERRHWGGAESVSGEGASAGQTERLRHALPALIERLGVRTLLDLPCGDLHWMSQVRLGSVDYLGADLLPELVQANQLRHAGERRRFQVLDLTRSPLPAADLLLCRDGLVHLSFADIAAAIANIRRAPIRYLLATTFPAEAANRNITTGDWRPLNLEAPPFAFRPPLAVLNEGCTEAKGRFGDKSLGLWEVATLPDLVELQRPSGGR